MKLYETEEKMVIMKEGIRPIHITKPKKIEKKLYVGKRIEQYKTEYDFSESHLFYQGDDLGTFEDIKKYKKAFDTLTSAQTTVDFIKNYIEEKYFIRKRKWDIKIIKKKGIETGNIKLKPGEEYLMRKYPKLFTHKVGNESLEDIYNIYNIIGEMYE